MKLTQSVHVVLLLLASEAICLVCAEPRNETFLGFGDANDAASVAAALPTDALVSLPPSPTSPPPLSTSTSPTMQTTFTMADGSYEAARVSADDVAASSAPPTPPSVTPGWAPGSVRSATDAVPADTTGATAVNNTDTPPVAAAALRTDVAGMSFSALPVTVNIDIQGFPFDSRAVNTAEKESSTVNSGDDGWWRTRVCGSMGDACALVPVGSDVHRRRLAGAVTKPREAGDLSDVETSLQLAAVTKTSAALFLVAAGFASAPFALVITTFAFVLTTLFAASANDAYIALLKAVNAQYGELNGVIQETADRITAAAEVRSMRSYVKQAIAFHTQLTSAASSVDASQPGAIAIRLKQTCEGTQYHDVKDALFNVQRVKAGIDQYYATRARGYVGECAYYLRGLTFAYLSYTKCELALKTDVKGLMANDKSLRSQMNQVARDMAGTADKMLQGFASNIKSEVEKLVGDGGDVAPMTSLNDKYDWLTFKVIRSDSGLCSDVTTGVVDVECGLVMVSKHRCQFITWYNTTAGGDVKSGLDLFKTYNGLAENVRCGYGSVLKTGKLTTKRPMQRQLSMDDAASSQPRRLVSAEQLPFSVYVKAGRAKGSSAPIQETIPEGTIDDATLNAGDDPLQEQLNNAKSEKERMKILSDSYTNTSVMSKSIKSRDLAVWFTLETNLKEVNDMYDERDTMVDGISTTVKNVHEVEMGRIKGIYNDVVTTGTQEVQALVDLEVQTTGQHNDEISEMGTIDGQLTTLSSTLDSGFSGTSSDIDTVERDTTAALGQLSGTVTDTGAKTRTEVKKVIAQATQKTLEHLDGLDDLIATKAQEKLGAVRGLQTLVESAGNQIRNGVATEFNARAQQLQDRVAGLTYHLSSVGSATANALVTESDAMRTELGRRIAFMTNQLEIIDGHVNATEKILSTINTQVDDILDMIGSLNTRLTGIFRTLRGLPNRIRQVVMVKSIEDKFRDGERLSFAYANYIKHGMAQLQAFEFIQQCGAVTESLLFDSLLDRLKRGEAVLLKELATFNNSRTDYEQYGNRIAAAAYHLRYMLVPCANMRTLKRTGKAEFGEGASRSQADKLNTALWTFQQSMEETVPQLFLKKIYTATYLQSVLDDIRRSVGSSGFVVAAIEQLRYQLQQQLGSYAVVTVVQPNEKSRLAVWTKVSKVSVGASRYGMLRLSTLLPTVAASDELLVLWSNTRQHIPTSLRTQFNIPLTKSDLASDATLTAAFKNTAYEPFWTAGLIQSVVFVERVNKTMCPWAVATSYYPYCWETGSYDDGGCVCVQIEGIAATIDAEKMASDEGPTPWSLQTTLGSATPRANFLISALNKATTTALTATTMVGAPENRRAFALCMSSPLPPRECITGRWCHQPPPSFTRCIANPAETYNIVYANDTSTQIFIKDGLSVTATMFRTLELGSSIPDVTFFDSQNGLGGYIVCTDCTMDVLKSIFMFRVMSFKVGRPSLEKTSICRQHPRFDNVEFCVRGATPVSMWTPQTMLQGELIQSVQQLGSSLPANITDPQELAVAVNTRIQAILGTEVSYFKVYVAKRGSFNASTNGDAFWTSLPTQEAGLERGWTVVSGLYSTISSNKVVAFDALVMWSTLPVEARNFAKLVVEKKPAGQPLKTYLQSAFGAYDREKILRGFFSEPFDGLDCPVAGDTDHFAYCTPVPVDKMCSCVQLEDLPEEYTELYDGSAPNGKVVSFVLEDDQSAYVVGRSKGSFSLGDRLSTAMWDGLPMRNVSERSVCMADYNRPELGASCFVESSSTVADSASLAASPAFPRVLAGVNVAAVTITTATWTAQCTGCSNAFISEITGFGSKATVTTGGFVAGGACRKSPAVGGGEIQVCLNQNA